MALSRTECRALVGDKSPGFGAANSTRLHDLTCLVWLTGKHRLPWLAPFAMWVMEQGRLQKYPKAIPMYCTGDDWVVNAKAREAALIGKCLRNTDFQFSADPMSTFLSNPHTYRLFLFFLKNPVMLNLHQRQTDSNNKKSCYSKPKGRHNSTSEPKCCLTANCLPLKHPTTDRVAQ